VTWPSPFVMERFEFENLTKERRKSLAQIIRPIRAVEMKKLGEELCK